MRLHVEVVADGAAYLLEQPRFHALGTPSRERVKRGAERHVLPARQVVGERLREDAPEGLGDGIDGGPRHHVGRRTLQHRDVCSPFGHGGDERDRGRAAADDDDALARVVEVSWPMLGMDEAAAKALASGEIRGVAAVVAVVARAHPNEESFELMRLSIGSFDGDRPQRPLARPGGALHALSEADALGDSILARGVLHVVEDGRAVGDGLRVAPRFERVAEGEHVRIRANARVAKQIPRPADGVARFEKDERFARTFAAQMARGSHAGQTGPDDDDIEALDHARSVDDPACGVNSSLT